MVFPPSWTCSHRGAKKSRCCKKAPSAARGAYCVLRCIADRPSRFVMLASLRLENFKPQEVCQVGSNLDSFDPRYFCAKFRCEVSVYSHNTQQPSHPSLSSHPSNPPVNLYRE